MIVPLLKRLLDSNDLAWTWPLPPWADNRDQQVRRIRIIARAVIRRKLIAERGRLYLLTSSLAWPLLAALKTVIHGHANRHLRFIQLLDIWWLQLVHNLRIEDQCYFRLDRPALRQHVRRLVTDGENKALMEFFNRDARPERIRDKIPFAQFCAQHQLPTIPVLAECDGEGTVARWNAPLPDTDLFLKPAALWSGQGAARFSHVSKATWRADDGTLLTRDTLAAYIDLRLKGIAWILQSRLYSGPAWHELSPDALATVRVVTGRLIPTSVSL